MSYSTIRYLVLYIYMYIYIYIYIKQSTSMSIFSFKFMNKLGSVISIMSRKLRHQELFKITFNNAKVFLQEEL